MDTEKKYIALDATGEYGLFFIEYQRLLQEQTGKSVSNISTAHAIIDELRERCQGIAERDAVIARIQEFRDWYIATVRAAVEAAGVVLDYEAVLSGEPQPVASAVCPHCSADGTLYNKATGKWDIPCDACGGTGKAGK